MNVPVRLLKGSDDVLRGEALSRLLDELVGEGDHSLLVEEVDFDQVERGQSEAEGESIPAGVDLGPLIDAAQTMPFLTDRRIVVARRFARFTKADQLKSLFAYLLDPAPTTELILVWEAPRGTKKLAAVPPTLTKAVKVAGEVIETGAPDKKGLGAWVADQFSEAGLDVDGRARNTIVASLGDDAGGLVGLIERLKGSFSPGTRIGVDDVEPLLGPAGGVPPWDLTDAIDRGDVTLSIGQLQRMMTGGGRHPLAVMATLQSHFLRMARLDGSGVRNEKEAAQILGMKGSTFPAKKALTQALSLGGAKVQRAVDLLAEADADLRGARAWLGELVMEVLVARLARLSR
ncbi:MAG: DNA polymerase III subunit delta [Actinomycetota bacterium]|nr:DNA polymerase III subunit delta [Actinomycetota bacterium]